MCDGRWEAIHRRILWGAGTAWARWVVEFRGRSSQSLPDPGVRCWPGHAPLGLGEGSRGMGRDRGGGASGARGARPFPEKWLSRPFTNREGSGVHETGLSDVVREETLWTGPRKPSRDRELGSAASQRAGKFYAHIWRCMGSLMLCIRSDRASVNSRDAGEIPRGTVRVRLAGWSLAVPCGQCRARSLVPNPGCESNGGVEWSGVSGNGIAGSGEWSGVEGMRRHGSGGKGS